MYHYQDITFSPNGNYIYFRIDALDTPKVDREDVYRIPVLGGQATRVLEGVDAPLSFIDGGQRVCFYRQNSVAGTYQFLSANAEGGDEQVLENGKKPFPDDPVCAPNGRFAVFPDRLGVQSLDFDSGRKQTLASSTTIGAWPTDLHWTPSGRGLFAIKTTGSRLNDQIGFLSHPRGIWRQITNDLSDYSSLSLTADGMTIATRTHDWNTKFGVLSLKDPSRITERQPEDMDWFTWLDNDRIVESSVKESGLSIVDLVKNEKTNISVAKGHLYFHPFLCGPDMLLVSGRSSDRLNAGVYKMHLDGSGLTQLTKGPVDFFPECTSDGKWLFYADNRDPSYPLLMRQSLQGGAAQVAAKERFWYDISPDGKFLITVATLNTAPLQIISTDSLKVVRTLPLVDIEDSFAFSADGKSIFYDTKTGEDTTIWRQPLDAATAVKVASMPGKNVYWIMPSSDGRKLGLVISTHTSEAVLIHDVR